MEKIIRTPDIDLECIGALCRAVTVTSPDGAATDMPPLDEALEKFSCKYAVPKDFSARLLELYHYMLDGVDLEDDFIKRCFSILPGDSSSLAEYLLLAQRSGGAAVLGLEDDIFFMLLVLAQNDLIGDDDQIARQFWQSLDLGKFTRIVAGSELPNETKLIYIETASMYREYSKRIRAVIAPMGARFTEKYPSVKGDVEAFCDDMDVRIEKKGGVLKLLSSVGLALDCEIVTIRPTLIFFNAVRTIFSTTIIKALSSNAQMKDQMDLCYGMLFNLGVDTDSDEASAARTMLKRLKALDDPTRFEVMCALNKEDQCGADLARLINVTPATISHHMNELASAGLVKIRKEGVKFMYSTNKEALKQLLENIAGKLL